MPRKPGVNRSQHSFVRNSEEDRSQHASVRNSEDDRSQHASVRNSEDDRSQHASVRNSEENRSQYASVRNSEEDRSQHASVRNSEENRLQHSFVREDIGRLYQGVTDEQLCHLASAAKEYERQRAFSELLNRYTDIMLAKAANVKPYGADMDDMMQECSLGLLDAVEAYKSEAGASFRTFAQVCIDNRLRSAVRRGMRYKAKPLSCYVELSDFRAQGVEQADVDADPEKRVLIEESAAELRSYIRLLLSDTEYRVFAEYLSGSSYNIIAKRLGTSAKSVDNALQRVRRKLKRAVEESENLT